MKKWIVLTILLCGSLSLRAQVKERLIFIGNGGIQNKDQEKIISDAAGKIQPGQTSVVFLGDNIYPKGWNAKKGEEVLTAQFSPFLEKGANIFFLPGDRDWNRSRENGLKKIEAQSRFLEDHVDTLLQMLPKNGCPGPVSVQISEQLLLIAMDTEWQLAHFGDTVNRKGCRFKTKEEAVKELWELVYTNRDKTILLVTHHPFISNGRYGKKFSIKDHLFPLRRLHPALYIPLPGIGSLYPLYKKAFPVKEELDHPFYVDMINELSGGFRGFPNAVHISAHEEGLQLNKDSALHFPEIVTAIGKNRAFLKKDPESLFQAATAGYVLADQYEDHLTFTFYGLNKKKEVEKKYEYVQAILPQEEWDNEVYTPLKEDTVVKKLRPYYEERGSFFRFLFGENYRKAWAAPVKLPALQLSTLYGGLTFRKMGGGNQTYSMRLKDSTGKQYVLRSVAKTPNRVIPQPLVSPFTRLVVDDFYSSQHPYSALVVPPLAEALDVPHADPVIGIVSADTVLGFHSQQFAGDAYMLEEWEPLHPTDNYPKAFEKLRDDNDNTFDGINFYRARMLDLLIGDWDRHPDQWRFHYDPDDSHRKYLIVPRDRDMALKVTNGLIDGFASYFAIIPHISGFNSNLTKGGNAKWGMFNSKFLNAEPASQIGHAQWTKEAQEFKERMTDSVLKAAVDQLPEGLNPEENQWILAQLKKRRDQMPAAMEKYYRFSNKIVDIRGTDTKELFHIKDVPGEDALHIVMRKISKEGELEDTLMEKVYPKALTKEIRIYLEKDFDSVVVDNKTSSIKLRIIGGEPTKNGMLKSYRIVNSKKKIRVYDSRPEHYYGKTNRLITAVSKDTAHTAFRPVNLYNTWLPMLTGGINRDDGVSLGVGLTFKQGGGFRKGDYSATHKLSVMHSLKTDAFAFNYRGDFSEVFGKADLLIDADIRAPQNTENFFGIGNNSLFKETGNPYRYYRTRFNLYQLRTAIKREWAGNKISIGPAVQYYQYNEQDNTDRFSNDVNKTDFPLSPDRKEIAQDKTHVGLVIAYELDKRKNAVTPYDGILFKTRLGVYSGINKAAHAYAQLSPELSFYHTLNAQKSLVFADRIGGAVTTGRPAFYQYAYLGGRGTLLGYRKYRFAGMHSAFNNAELRLRLADFGNYVFRGQIGLTGFFDVGRVWVKEESSKKWHTGWGGGVFLIPANAAVLHFVMGHSPQDGWYPYLTFGFRF